MKARGARARDTVAAAAMAAVAFVGFVVVDAPPRPVRAARSIGATAVPARMVPPATARSVLLRADALELDAGQRARLSALASAWDGDVAPHVTALTQASEDFGQFADRVQRAGRARLDDLSHRMQDVQALSASLRERRRGHEADALAVLTDLQRARMTAAPHREGGSR